MCQKWVVFGRKAPENNPFLTEIPKRGMSIKGQTPGGENMQNLTGVMCRAGHLQVVLQHELQ
jgi:hypothetical protein